MFSNYLYILLASKQITHKTTTDILMLDFTYGYFFSDSEPLLSHNLLKYLLFVHTDH